MANISLDKLQEIIKNRPTGVSETSIISGLKERGHILEGQQSGANFLKRLSFSFGDEKSREKIRLLEKVQGTRGKFDVGDIADVAGEIPSLAGFVGGGALGSLAGPAGAIAGGAVGASAGEAIRQTIGKGLGTQEKFEPGQIALEGGIAAATGGIGKVLGVLGKGVAKNIPLRLVRDAIGQTKSSVLAKGDIAPFVMEKVRFGSLGKMLSETLNAEKNLGKQISNILVNPDNIGKAVTKKSIINEAIKNPLISGAKLNAQRIINTVKRIAPRSENLISQKTLTLKEANTLRQLIDKALGPKAFISQQNPFDKDVLLAARKTLENFVKSNAKATEPLFEELSKEITLKRLLKSKEAGGLAGRKIIGFRDLLGFGIGGAVGGLPGAAIGVGLEKFGGPAIETTSAIGIKKLSELLSKPVVRGVGRTGLFEALRQIVE